MFVPTSSVSGRTFFTRTGPLLKNILSRFAGPILVSRVFQPKIKADRQRHRTRIASLVRNKKHEDKKSTPSIL